MGLAEADVKRRHLSQITETRGQPRNQYGELRYGTVIVNFCVIGVEVILNIVRGKDVGYI